MRGRYRGLGLLRGRWKDKECDIRPAECWSHYQGVRQRSISVDMTVLLLTDVGRFALLPLLWQHNTGEVESCLLYQ